MIRWWWHCSVVVNNGSSSTSKSTQNTNLKHLYLLSWDFTIIYIKEWLSLDLKFSIQIKLLFCHCCQKSFWLSFHVFSSTGVLVVLRWHMVFFWLVFSLGLIFPRFKTAITTDMTSNLHQCGIFIMFTSHWTVYDLIWFLGVFCVDSYKYIHKGVEFLSCDPWAGYYIITYACSSWRGGHCLCFFLSTRPL